MDQISDMLTRIRNAQATGRTEAIVPASKLKMAIAQVLANEGFVVSARMEKDAKSDHKQSIHVELKYESEDVGVRRKPAISYIRRISKSGQRQYAGKNMLREVKNGYGILVVSTSRGVMSGKEARKKGLGGEVVCEVW